MDFIISLVLAIFIFVFLTTIQEIIDKGSNRFKM